MRRVFVLWAIAWLIGPASWVRGQEPPAGAPAPAAEEPGEPEPDAEEPLGEDDAMVLNFQGADIREVIHSLAGALGINYQIDPRVEGNITIRTTGKVAREDLFPLLRTLAAERGRADIASVINELEREHSTMERQWSRLREQLAGGGVDADDVMRFAWLCRRHMQYEAAALLPFAAEALSAEQRATLAARMTARRGMPA